VGAGIQSKKEKNAAEKLAAQVVLLSGEQLILPIEQGSKYIFRVHIESLPY
jgi:hypothetical protein